MLGRDYSRDVNIDWDLDSDLKLSVNVGAMRSTATAPRASPASPRQSGGHHRDDPQRGDPQRGDPQRGDPHRGDPHRGDPHRGDTQRGDPHRGNPQRGDPQRGDPKRGDPHRGETHRGDSQRVRGHSTGGCASPPPGPYPCRSDQATWRRARLQRQVSEGPQRPSPVRVAPMSPPARPTSASRRSLQHQLSVEAISTSGHHAHRPRRSNTITGSR